MGPTFKGQEAQEEFTRQRKPEITYKIQLLCTPIYEVVSKIFLTGAAIYTAVVVARSTGANRPKCEFRVILRRFAANA
jgi:hypothetical protein